MCQLLGCPVCCCLSPPTSPFGFHVLLNLLSINIIKIFLNRVGHCSSHSVLWWLHLHIATLPYMFKLLCKTSFPCHVTVMVDPPACKAKIHMTTMKASLWSPLPWWLQTNLDNGLIVGVLKSLSSVVNIFSYVLHTRPYLKPVVVVVMRQGWSFLCICKAYNTMGPSSVLHKGSWELQNDTYT